MVTCHSRLSAQPQWKEPAQVLFLAVSNNNNECTKSANPRDLHERWAFPSCMHQPVSFLAIF